MSTTTTTQAVRTTILSFSRTLSPKEEDGKPKTAKKDTLSSRLPAVVVSGAERNVLRSGTALFLTRNASGGWCVFVVYSASSPALRRSWKVFLDPDREHQRRILLLWATDFFFFFFKVECP